jgi:outer membrane protein assembly factor BamB
MLGGCIGPSVRGSSSRQSLWPMASVLTSPGNPTQDGNRGAPPGEEVLRVRWRRLIVDPPLIEYKPQEFASPAAGGERIYVGSRKGEFFALRRDDGDVLWRRHIQGGLATRPLFLPRARMGDELIPTASGGMVFLGSGDGVLHALDAVTGKEHWTYRTKSPIAVAPVYAEGLLYFTTGENRLYAIDARTGAWRWQYEREVPDSFTIRGASAPLAAQGRVYGGFSDGYVVALNGKDGEVLWARAIGGDETRFVDVDATPTLADGTLYVSSHTGGVYALDPNDGNIRWRYPVEGAGTVRVAGDRVYFGAVRDGLHCLDLQGHLLWRQSLAKQGVLSSPVTLGTRYLLLSASEGGTFVVDPMDGHLLQSFDPGHGVSSEPVSDGHQVYVLTNTGFIYAFALQRG